MTPDKRILAITLVGSLMLAGCGKPQTELQPGAGEPTETAAAGSSQPEPVADPAATEVVTNKTLTGSAAFAAQALANSFAQAEPGLRGATAAP